MKIKVPVEPEKKPVATTPADITDEALWCRTERHLWKWVKDEITVGTDAKPVEFRRHNECLRCKARKNRTISARTWTVQRSRIAYPDLYLIKGAGRHHSSEFYREQMARPAHTESGAKR